MRTGCRRSPVRWSHQPPWTSHDTTLRQIVLDNSSATASTLALVAARPRGADESTSLDYPARRRMPMVTVEEQSVGARFSQALRNLTWNDHEKAEYTDYMQALLDGKLHREGYAALV